MLTEVARELHAHSLSEELNRTLDEMDAEAFRFVVVGEFSRGKSTVINALLGDRLLPSSVEPTTAVLTSIQSGFEKQFKIVYRDNRSAEMISEAGFRELVAPFEPAHDDREGRQQHESREAELRTIAVVEINHPAEILKQCVEIVDTPGTNDLDPLREQITYDYIPRADAILFVLTARRGLTRTELDFLRDRVLKTDVARIFFLLNYADVLTPSDLQEQLNMCTADLATVVKEPRLYPVSARKALQARTGMCPGDHTYGNFIALEQALASFLQSERSKAKLSRPISRGLRICEELLAGPITMSRSTLDLGIPELEDRIRQLSPRMREIQTRRNRTIGSLRVKLTNRATGLTSRMREGLYSIADAALNAVDTYTGPLTAEELGRHIEGRVAPVHSEFQSAFRSEAANAFQEEFSAIEAEISFAQDLMALFGPDEVSLTPAVIEVPVKLGSRYFMIAGAGLGLAFLPLFGPFAILAGWHGRGFLEEWLRDTGRRKKLGEIRNTLDQRYRGRIADSISHFQKVWHASVDEAVAALDTDFDCRSKEVQSALKSALAELTQAKRSSDKKSADLNGFEARIFAIKKLLPVEGLV